MMHVNGKDNWRGVKVLSTPTPLRLSNFTHCQSACAAWLLTKVIMGNFVGSTLRAWRLGHGPRLAIVEDTLIFHISPLGTCPSVTRYPRVLHELLIFIAFILNKNFPENLL
jgi:hypothetical protein